MSRNCTFYQLWLRIRSYCGAAYLFVNLLLIVNVSNYIYVYCFPCLQVGGFFDCYGIGWHLCVLYFHC